MKRVAAAAAAALRAVPRGLRPLVERIDAAGERLELGVHLVGGPVRDLLLGRPLLDVDLLVEARGASRAEPAVLLARSAVQGDERIVAHARFGTVSVHAPAGIVDLARARTEQYAADGALPSVRAGTLEQDLWRRDFSVNALAIPLNAVARAGRPALVDLVGGRRDLATRTLRVLHARSFHDDPTRALRAARFAARLGFRLEPGSRAALAAACAAGSFGAVSGERFRAELERSFADAQADPGQVLARLAGWGVLGALVPGLALPRGTRPGLRWLGLLLAAPPPGLVPDALLASLMCWLAPEAPARRRRLLARLAVSGRPATRVLAFPALSRRLSRALRRPASRGADDARLRPLPPEELLALAAFASSDARRRILRHANEDRALVLPVDGADLVALGLEGPAIGRALTALRRAFLDGVVADREQALAFAQARRSRARSEAKPDGVTTAGRRGRAK
jgi:tRNA nucleotidyltransferase (CCA-adding enzyme)